MVREPKDSSSPPSIFAAYLDTNVFHKIGYGDSQAGDNERLLHEAVQMGKIIVLASLVTLGEIIDGLGSPNPDKRDRALQQLRIAWRLSDWSRTINQTAALVTQDIHAYVLGRGRASPFLAGADRDHFLRGLRGVMDDARAKTPEELARDLSGVVEENKRQKWSFSEGMNEGRGRAAKELRERGIPYPSFDQVWEIYSVRMLQNWASRAGLVGALKADETEGLLRRRVVRVSIAASLALWYTREFPIEGPPPKFRPSDSRDLHHVLSAAAADAEMFVCQEYRLPRVIELIQGYICPLQVTNLDGLIARIEAE
jgi:hypothetical protein